MVVFQAHFHLTCLLTLEALREGGEIDTLDFFCFKFLLLRRLSKAFIQLFFVPIF